MSLVHAIFSDRQSRIFRWLFGQPQASFYLNELRRLTGLSSASLQQELQRLTHSGVVLSSRRGNLRVFQANTASPLFEDLVSIVRKTCGVEVMVRDALQALRPKLSLAYIYGSVAKETDTASSDIDVMLIGMDLRLSEALACLQPVEDALGRKINPTCYTVQEFDRRRADENSFVSKVLAQPVIEVLKEANGN